MFYHQIIPARFIGRDNRFIARVMVEGREEVVHVKNTGRCRELLLPGVEVYLEASRNPQRRTAYSLVAVRKGDRLINMDSSAPNEAATEALTAGLLTGKLAAANRPFTIRREVRYGASRFDFCIEGADRRAYIEVKGVTLEENGVVRFPDAPTVRGTRHIYELMEAVREGHEGCLLFVIQMKGVRYFAPCRGIDPAFADALLAAASNGVQILAYDCEVTPEGMRLSEQVEVKLHEEK